MRAIERLRIFDSDRSSRADPLEGLTLQEKALYLEVVTDSSWAKISRNPMLRDYFLHSRYADRAINLDAGGIFLGNNAQIASYDLGQAQWMEMDVAEGDKDKVNVRRPGSDDVSARHVCTADTSSLANVVLRDLLKGTVNVGKRITLTVERKAFFTGSVSLLVRDDAGDVTVLNLYNCVPSDALCRTAEKTFPAGTTILVKEPYLKCFNTGLLGLRVDNPCNVIIKRQSPPSLELEDKTALPTFYAASDQLVAAEACIEALSLNASPAVRAAAICSRAVVLHKLQRYAGALAEYEAALALEPDSEKAALGRGVALYELKRFAASVAVFSGLVARTGNSVLAQRELARAQSAMQNVAGFFNIRRGNSSLHDAVDFFGPIEVRAAGAKGRGLFLTADVKKDDLLFFEKVLVSRKVRDKTKITVALNWETRKTNSTSQHSVVSDLIYAAAHNEALNARLSLLADGSGATKSVPSIASIRDGTLLPVPPVSAFQVAGIVSTNAFGGSNAFGSNTKKEFSEEGDFTSIFLVTSFMNHEHVSRATTRTEMLDHDDDNDTSVLVFASRSMKSGTELTTTYSLDDSKLTSWGICATRPAILDLGMD